MKKVPYIVAIAAALVGCTQRVSSTPFVGDGPNNRPFIDVEAPGPGLQLDTGNGQDGPLSVDNMDLVINECVVVLAAAGTSMQVSDATAFAPARRVIVFQMQDDFATSGPSTPVLAPASAGEWEIARVESVSGTTLTLQSGLKSNYNSAGSVTAQVCTVKEFTTVTVTATGRIVASPWDGVTGGVVAFYANDVVTLDGAVWADEAGYRGGIIRGSNGEGNIELETTSDSRGGGKGEGLDGRSWLLAGRGAMGNAGGGGNGHNAGGGGGGNGGAGGMGGKQPQSQGDNPNTRGRFGAQVTLSIEYMLTFGGGGGAAHDDDGQSGDGGAGGGAIFISAWQLDGSGLITANGQRGFDGGVGGNGDGGGGGGAGGSILVRTLAGTFSGEASAQGGAGGDHVSNNAQHGTGGGGGGGVIQEMNLDSATLDASGAISGVNTQSGNDPWGASEGLAGLISNL